MKQSMYIAFVSMICFIVACKKENQTPKVIDIPNIPLEKIEGTITSTINFVDRQNFNIMLGGHEYHCIHEDSKFTATPISSRYLFPYKVNDNCTVLPGI